MTDSYPTPTWLLNCFEGFFDPCPLNDSPTFDGLSIDWKKKTYVNPPYSNPLPWVKKAIREREREVTSLSCSFGRMFQRNTLQSWFLQMQRYSFSWAELNSTGKDLPRGATC